MATHTHTYTHAMTGKRCERPCRPGRRARGPSGARARSSFALGLRVRCLLAVLPGAIAFCVPASPAERVSLYYVVFEMEITTSEQRGAYARDHYTRAASSSGDPSPPAPPPTLVRCVGSAQRPTNPPAGTCEKKKKKKEVPRRGNKVIRT